MLARSTIAVFALSLLGCVVETVPCSSAASPVCPDGGGIDAGRDAPGSDTAADTNTRPDTGADGGPCARCGGATPVCVADVCVACAVDSDCTGDDRCNVTTNQCVACLGTAGDICPAATPACNTTTFECVACLTNANCTTVGASVCNLGSHICEPCNAAGECSHLTATPVCDITAMTCVDCVSNADCSATEGCNLSTHACVPFTVGSAGPCATCVRDAECRTGQLCVPMNYDDPTTPAADPVPAGSHCLWRQDAAGPGGPAGACSTIRPYVRGTSMTSVDGTTTTMCSLRVSTCEAQTAFSSVNCMTLDVAGDAMCGQASVHDGVCRTFDVASNRCTVFCGSDDDCPSGFMCDTGSTPRVCLF